jgi:hypothetical protein
MKTLMAILMVLASRSALAFERGDTCTLEAPLPMVMRRPEGRVETTIDRGVEIIVQAVGDEGRIGITTGDASGSVSARDLEAACAGTLQLCRLKDPITMYEKTRSDSQAWKLKPGATVSVLRSGKVWSHIRVDDLEGFVGANEVKGACVAIEGGVVNDNADPTVTEEVERGEGPGVLFLPFQLEGAAPQGQVDAIGDLFFERLAIYRPDAARLTDTERRAGKWKAYVARVSSRATAAGMNYAVVGHAAVENVDGKGVIVVSMAAIDARAGTISKGIRVKTSLDLADPWPENTLAVLLPFLASAPGARAPPPPPSPATPKEEQPKKQTTTTTTAPTEVERAGWYANPWGYLAVGGAVAAGVGAGVLGSFSLQENSAANDLSPLDDARAARRQQALEFGIGSDVLAGAAIVAGVAGVVVFATRAGLDDY